MSPVDVDTAAAPEERGAYLVEGYHEAVRDERVARRRHRNLERARRAKRAKRERAAAERLRRDRARLRELEETEERLAREYLAAYREANRLGLRASQERFDRTWDRAAALGDRLRAVIGTRRELRARIEKTTRRDESDA
jgi:hypothetical protein